MDLRPSRKVYLFREWRAAGALAFLGPFLVVAGLVPSQKKVRAAIGRTSPPPPSARARAYGSPAPPKALGAPEAPNPRAERAESRVPAPVLHYETNAQLPMRFEANQGQVDRRVKFLARGSGYELFLTSSEAVLALEGTPLSGRASDGDDKGREAKAKDEQTESLARTVTPSFKGLTENRPTRNSPLPISAAGVSSTWPATRAFLRLKLVGANRAPRLSALDALPGKSNYFIGKDPSSWHIAVPTYRKVAYPSVYPGIDLIYYGNPGQLEYDFVVGPGANPRVIKFSIEGAAKLEIDSFGDLVVHVGNGEIRLRRPGAYQEDEGVRRAVPAQYKLFKEQNKVGFQIAAFDRRKALTIDPVLAYSSYLGGSSADQGSGITVDSSGAVYVTGQTLSVDFPATSGALQTNLRGPSDAFVAKFDTTRSGAPSLIYATYLGGNDNDLGRGIAVDSQGNAYATGQTSSSDFPTTPTAFQTRKTGPATAFLIKLSTDGATLVYSTYLGGSGTDAGASIALDPSGIAYLTGQTSSSDFPVTAGAFQSALSGGKHAFVAKIDTTQSEVASLLSSTYLGGSLDDGGNGISVDSDGNAYVTGLTASTDFPTQGAFQSALNGGTGTDAFITKLNSDLSALDYSTYLGGSGNDSASGIAVGGNGLAYVTGETFSTNFPVLGAFQGSLRGVEDAFVVEVDTTKTGPNSLVYSSYLGGGGPDRGSGIAVDSSGYAYLTGTTASTDFPFIEATQSSFNGGGSDAFVTKVNSTGSALIFSTYLGGSDDDTGSGIALDTSGTAFVVGTTSSTNFPSTANAFQTAIAGGTDTFVAKLTELKLPSISLDPIRLSFGNQNVGNTSPTQTVRLTNTGDADLIPAIPTSTTGADYILTNDCGSAVAAQASCAITVAFDPQTPGTHNETVLVKDANRGDITARINLTGTGHGPTANLPANLTFTGPQVVGTSSAQRTVVLGNRGNANLSITRITIAEDNSADFTQTNNCGTTLAMLTSCNILVTFTPSAAGARTGALTITDNALGSPHTVNLSGTGADFSLSSFPTSMSVSAGTNATYTLTVSPVGGLKQTVSLVCKGAPVGSICGITPPDIALDGSSAATSTVIVLTVARSTVPPPGLWRGNPRTGQPPAITWLVWLLPLASAALVSARSRGRAGRRTWLGPVAILILVALWASCGGGSGGQRSLGTPAGTYTLTFTGSFGALSHNTTASLTVR